MVVRHGPEKIITPRGSGIRHRHPRVRGHGVHGDALGRVHDEHLADEVAERRGDALQGRELAGHDGGLLRGERRRAANHLVQDHAQAPDVDFGAVGLALDLGVLDGRRQVHHRDLRQDLALALVVAGDLVGAVEGAARGVVQEAVAQEVQDVLEVHLRHVLAVDGLHNVAVLDALVHGLGQGVALVALHVDDLDDARALSARAGGVLADAEGAHAVLRLEDARDLLRLREVEVVAARQDHLRGHGLQRADAGRGLHGAVLRPVPRTEIDELHVGLVRISALRRAEQNVVGLEVAVDHLLGVNVLHRGDDLLEDVPGLALVDPALLLQDVAQLAAGGELHHDHLPPGPALHVALDVHRVDHLHDVLVGADVPVDVHLGLELGPVRLLLGVQLHAPHGDDLDRTPGASFVLTHVDAAVCASAQDLVGVQLVLAENRGHRVAIRRRAPSKQDAGHGTQAGEPRRAAKGAALGHRGERHLGDSCCAGRGRCEGPERVI
mmetsp:Transcript_50331/g.133093  ORF Transcript_50331/g.133093 Transcript_50331/m.133093 type:complete len:494 (-) Transcript_50331:9-1490(-)